MTNSLLSVLLCVYKNDNPYYLYQCLNSVLTLQVYKPNEVIIVIDGPIPLVLENEIQKFSFDYPSIIKVVRSEVNRGLAAALNLGVKNCNGFYIARMDSDDISLPNRFLLQMNFLLNNPNIDVLGGAIEEVDENTRFLIDTFYPLSHEDIVKFLPKGAPFAHPTVVIKRSVLIDNPYNDGFNVFSKYEVSSNEDIELWFRLTKKSYLFANIPEKILQFRRSKNFFKKRNYKQAFMEFKIFWKGTYQIFGFSIFLIYPVLRLFVRFLPKFLLSFAYNYRNLIK